MSAMPGEPIRQKAQEVTLKHGRKVTLMLPGMPRRIEPDATEERGAAEPPRDNPAPAQPVPRDLDAPGRSHATG